jgi:hypothetical protein
MAKRNGGIIGPDNVPTGQYGGVASGVWRLEDAFNYQKDGLWPGSESYPITNSLRFNSGSSDNLNRTTWGTATSDKIFTMSFWTKRSNLSSTQQLVNAYDGTTGNDNQIKFNSSDQLSLTVSSSGAEYFLTTTQLFRDVSAWYHIVFAYDSTQATSSNRYKLYVNGSQITSFGTANYPTQNLTYQFFRNSNANRIGCAWGGSAEFLNGYMSEFYFIDGQALTPSSFGETDSTTGIWIPKQYSGTYGTNGFFLKFANSASLGTDSSGNGNNFTVNNLTSVDQSYDTPTNNFCTFNPLTNTGVTVSEGNLKGVYSTNDANLRCTFGVNKGKWYWESKVLGTASGLLYGIIIENTPQTTGRADSAGIYGLQNAGTSFAYADTNGSRATSAGFPNPVANDIIQCALDLDNDKFYMGINGTFYNLSGTTANPATGSNATWTLDSSYDGVIWFPFYEFRSSAESTELNFGYPPFTISSGNADANGFGNFEYAVPSGYYALCSKNLALYG